MKYQSVVYAPFGSVGIVLQQGCLRKIDLLWTRDPGVFAQDDGAEPGVARKIRRYLQDPSVDLTTPLAIRGSEFQHRVWRCLRQIPVGETRTYGELAEVLHSSARAVGNACRSNPCPLVIPCHRVVGKAGLGGFSGQTSGPGLEIKRWLLSHEGWL